MKKVLFTFICAAPFAFASSAPAASGCKLVMPDFTKGRRHSREGEEGLESRPDRAARVDVLRQARDHGCAASRRRRRGQRLACGCVFAVGDVLLGAGWKAFSFDPGTELGRAIAPAETEAGGGKLALTRWPAARRCPVTLQINRPWIR